MDIEKYVQEQLQKEHDPSVERTVYGHTLLFTEEDVANADHALVKVLRAVLYKNGITREEFVRRHRQRCVDSGISSSKVIGDKFNNYIKEIKRDRITWPKFCEFLFAIMGYQMNDLEITMTVDNGKKMKFGLNELAALYAHARRKEKLSDKEE